MTPEDKEEVRVIALEEILKNREKINEILMRDYEEWKKDTYTHKSESDRCTCNQCVKKRIEKMRADHPELNL